MRAVGSGCCKIGTSSAENACHTATSAADAAGSLDTMDTAA
ncbi:hypothetical protein [Caproicibacter sp.]